MFRSAETVYCGFAIESGLFLLNQCYYTKQDRSQENLKAVRYKGITKAVIEKIYLNGFFNSDRTICWSCEFHANSSKFNFDDRNDVVVSEHDCYAR